MTVPQRLEAVGPGRVLEASCLSMLTVDEDADMIDSKMLGLW